MPPPHGRSSALLCLVATAIALGLWAPSAGGANASASGALSRLRQDVGASVETEARAATGSARFVRIPAGQDLVPPTARAATPGARANSFLANHGSLFGLNDPAQELVEVENDVDTLGNRKITYEQIFDGIPVYGSRLNAHFDADGRLRMMAGATAPVPPMLVTTPALDSNGAATIAMARIANQRAIDPAWIDTDVHGLRIFPVGLLSGKGNTSVLTWEVEVKASSAQVREFVFVDAHNGDVVETISGIQEAIQRTVSEGSLSNVVWQEGDVDPITAGWEGGTTTQVSAWQDEIDGAKETYNLIGSITGGTYLSYDSADAVMRTINNDPSISCPNATWNGISANYCSGTSTDDIVAHEWGHGYTQYTSSLIYQWQSGAMNESYSDIWGETVDLLNGRGTDTPGGPRAADGSQCSQYGDGSPASDASYRWLEGEDAYSFGGAIRDLWRPECYGDPGRVTSGSYHCESWDAGGVHINSGVPNHLYALLVDGGSYNGRTIAAIGLTKAAHVFWRAGITYLVPASDFRDLAVALETSCADLIGTPLNDLSVAGPSSWGTTGPALTSADCAAVVEAVAATELRTAAPCSFDTLLDANAPDLCTETINTIVLQDWESGLGGWSASTRAVANPATFDAPDWSVVTGLPSGRAGSAAFAANLRVGNCSSDTEAGVLVLESPDITIPAGVSALSLAFVHYVATEAQYDGGNVKISVNGGSWTLIPGSAFRFNTYTSSLKSSDNPMGGEEAFHGTDGGTNGGSWGQSQVDLSAFASAGDTVRLRMEKGSDGCNGVIGWYVDDVRVYSCGSATPTPTPTPTATPTPTPTETPGGGPTPTPSPTPTPTVTPTASPDGYCSSPGVSIPDGSGSVTDTIALTDAQTLSDLNVFLEITHSWVGDLIVHLTHVSTGTDIRLLDRTGQVEGDFGCNGDNVNATLDDEASEAANNACDLAGPTAVSGTLSPVDLLSDFDGLGLAGDWTLTVSDASPSDTGTLVSWCLQPTADPTASCGNGIVESGEQCDAGSDNGTGNSCCQANCQFKADGAASCDGNTCTTGDTCSAGVCSVGSCNTGASCSFCGGSCSEAGGNCECGF